VYADVDGNTGRQDAGLIPRRPGWNGALPVEGASARYEWTGWLTLDERPHAIRLTAAASIAANGNRAREGRLQELLSAAATFGSADVRRQQTDVVAWNAERIVPLLAALRSDRADVEQARQRLLAWDKRMTVESSDAAVYALWERTLLQRLVDLRIPRLLAPEFVARAEGLLVPALTAPSAVWFDGDASKARDALLLAALQSALDESRGGSADKPVSAWGQLHTALFAHPLAISPDTRARFNVGPIPMPGYGDTVMSTGGPQLAVTVGASFRLIVDLADWDRTLVINAPGQSGSPASPHFADLAKKWAAGEYIPLAFSEKAVAAAAESTLVLSPR
jgi:penicillin amidase